MFVAALGLTDFRNYESLDIELHPGPNLIVGSNGQGKTNLVEALAYLSTLGSHRVSSDVALIRQGQDAAIVRARLRHGERQLLVELQLNRTGANKAQVNRSPVKTRDLPRSFSSVLFAPEDLAIVRGEPSVRRRFMDELLVLRTPRMTGVMADYDRVLRQRNTLLKSARAVRSPDLSTLDIWDERLVALGSELIEARSRLVTDLGPEVATRVRGDRGRRSRGSLAQPAQHPLEQCRRTRNPTTKPPTVTVSITVDVAANHFREALTRVRRAELDRGLTLVGPHRDDLVLDLNGMPARGYASHGESWSFALSLKLASAQVLRRESQAGDPVLMLDDVFAELDESRRERLADAIADYEQVLITAAVFGDVPERLAGNVVRIRAGAVVAPIGGGARTASEADPIAEPDSAGD